MMAHMPLKDRWKISLRNQGPVTFGGFGSAKSRRRVGKIRRPAAAFPGNPPPPPALNFMPRFYVHIKEHAHLIRDEEGIDLPTAEDARAEALRAARELWSDAINGGTDLDVEGFVIADETGRELASVAVDEVLPKRARYQH
jgi:hypothetical protein